MMSKKVAARERARVAKAALDRRRVETDKAIVDATTDFYGAVDAVEEAQALVAAAEAEEVKAVARLAELGQSVSEISSLCGITETEVRALRRRAGRDSGSGDTPSGESSSTGVGGDAAAGGDV